MRVDWCSYEAAKYAMAHWYHYPDMPRGRLVKCGVWEDDAFVGAILFGDGVSKDAFKQYGLTPNEGAELVRVAMRTHACPVTQALAVAIRMLHKANPGLRMLISFANPEAGHKGGIYQAGNWIFAGLTSTSEEYVVNGVQVHGRGMRMTREKHRLGGLKTKNTLEWVQRAIDPNAFAVKGAAKLRYLFPLDRAMRKRLEQFAQPFPSAYTGVAGP